MPLLPYETAEAVQADGIARVAVADDGTEHVLYLDGETVRSMLSSDWPPPLPTPPTAEQSAAARAARESAREQANRDALQLRQRIITTAQSAVGASVDALTAGQVRALLACLLYRAGAINAAGTVQPLKDWM